MLADRGMVYQPNGIKGNKPVTIVHQYSTVMLLPEIDSAGNTIWIVPLATRWVRSDADKELVGATQFDALIQNERLPFYDRLCVQVGDTSYSNPAYLHAHRKHPNLVTIARARSTAPRRP